MFDVGVRLDELRVRPTVWLAARRDELVREQRRLRVEELAVTRVLDERGALDDTLAGRDGVSLRSVRETVETARALESLPAVAAAAYAGELSGEQLGQVAVLADEESDAEWARRAPNVAPADLARLARTKTKPTVEDGRARRAARSLRMWWRHDTGMLHVAGELADVDGARFEAVINRMVERMRPAKGEAWDSREHRAADALVELADRYGHDDTIVGRVKPLLVVEVPLRGPAEIVGIPLPDAMVESPRANAAIEPVLVDDGQVPVAIGRQHPGLSPKIARAILLRDGRCRVGDCERREGLQIHHLVPRSQGGTDDPSNLAAVCVGGPSDHLAQLVPYGTWTLAGNPNHPDGLELVRTGDARAGP